MYFCVLEEENGKKTAKKCFFVGVEWKKQCENAWQVEKTLYLCTAESPDGGIGRRAGLKHQWIHFHAGSIPALGTEKRLLIMLIATAFLIFHYILDKVGE